ncbi:hypothetical protein B7R21_03050 [Subtercola boreus]|uniref:Uncharacterized protein n=1 Tax=Subtercola boreus TaxID=120213 RepID=A0A3E0W0P1_9MICO|nr:hypothetical protein [Subtercola boreus]RFA15944.1 hypothetical protein B7R21_03050 [Subtercola boreus]
MPSKTKAERTILLLRLIGIVGTLIFLSSIVLIVVASSNLGAYANGIAGLALAVGGFMGVRGMNKGKPRGN